jgi:hypothetical protein
MSYTDLWERRGVGEYGQVGVTKKGREFSFYPSLQKKGFKISVSIHESGEMLYR